MIDYQPHSVVMVSGRPSWHNCTRCPCPLKMLPYRRAWLSHWLVDCTVLEGFILWCTHREPWNVCCSICEWIHMLCYNAAFVSEWIHMLCYNADFRFAEFSTDITRALVAMRDVSFHIFMPVPLLDWCWRHSVLRLSIHASVHVWLYTKSLLAPYLNKKLIRRWDSERELSLRWHRTRDTKYNRLLHKFRHSSTRRLCVGTYVYQIQWNNAM